MVDLNCDMGEGMVNDEAIMPFITSANIACGFHAGDITTIEKTARLCIEHSVHIGAHPSLPDKEHFGRKEFKIDEHDIYDLVTRQLVIMDEVLSSLKVKLYHVKPHGALYNQSAKDLNVATAIATAIRDYDPSLILFGLSGSASILAGQQTGLRTMQEVFADRTYQDDGSLTPRTAKDAILTDVTRVKEQVRQIIHEGMVTTLSHKRITLVADTICIHGDGQHAVEFAKALHQMLNGMS